MSTKFSYWLRNEDKSSKKSAGCLTGIFQLFDRQFLLSSEKLNGQYLRKSPSADAIISLCEEGADYPEFCKLNPSRSYQENSRSSMELSTRTSVSSSSTSCSSRKHRLPKQEPKSSEHSFSSVKSPKNSAKPRSTDINQSPGFRESIKESARKDLKNVSIKEKTKVENKRNKVLKPVDSPRPTDLSKMKELEESLEILIKLREFPNNFNGVGSSPRFSSDGRISTCIKRAATQKEQKRFSLDSMEDSLRRDFNSKVNSFMMELKMKTNSRISEASNPNQNLRSNENNTSIVAKLMGLEPIDSARESSVKVHEPVRSQWKEENKHGKSPKSRISINPHMKSNSNSRLVVEETQQNMAFEGNMKQKIESVYNAIENKLQKLEFQHNSKETRDLRRAVLERKNSAKSLRPTNKSERAIISERALKSPFFGMKPESKSAGISSSPCAKFEGPSGLRKIKTCDLSTKKKDSLITDEEQTPKRKTAKSLNSLAKETIKREEDNFRSPRLQKRANSCHERKYCALITSYELEKNQKPSDNRQQSESVSPSSRIKQKSSKAQLNEVKSHTFHEIKGKRATTVASVSEYKQHQILPKKVVSVEELEKIDPQLSSPNSVLGALPYQDGLLLSPSSISSISNGEDENLPADHNLNPIHLPQNLPSTTSFEKDSQKQENVDDEAHKFIFPGTATGNNIDPEYKYVAEVLLSSSLLAKDSHMAAILNQIKLVEPIEKSNTQKLHKQLVSDVVNEILTRKMEAFNSGCQHDHLLQHNKLSLQQFKELCFEVKDLQASIDTSSQQMNAEFTKDLLQPSNAWDRSGSEVHVVVSDIESLIFVDLTDEVASSLIDLVLQTKRRNRRWLFV
ncbi:protein LONGIFOLIA 1-like isoform X2 [Phalaenopsis equestris]|uniref:protein LONGIFOLIA 1-like isoform X2 n=1 Tax=Phalaenopsis equestris TaxID=78828 RepID=UPI0009E1B8BE|nr:protein LONGIFOLIA 1-like isoform X2 [Phalaenopsis equestris]